MYKGGYVYIITNTHHTTLFIGVTSDLKGRTWQHENHYYKGSFSDKYHLEKLVFYKGFDSIEEAIAYETKIKKWSREKKNELIISFNGNH